jgi:hypothetical protein
VTEETISFPEVTEDQRRVHRAKIALHRDGASPAGALELLAAIIEDRTWEKVGYTERFREFVADHRDGLDCDAEQLKTILRLEHPHEDRSPPVKQRMDRMRREVRRLLRTEIPEATSHGGDHRSPSYQPRDTRLILSDKDTADAALARLKRDDPILAERVINGEITANAAARAKGWRHPRIVVTSPAQVARQLRRHWSTEQLAELARLLSDWEHEG